MKLNMVQRRIVELEPNGHVTIKGVAGSGKTTVAIRRISFLQLNTNIRSWKMLNRNS